MPFMSEIKCVMNGINVWDYWHDPYKMAEAELKTFSRFPCERIVIGPNTRGIAEALGAVFVYPENGVPYAGPPVLDTPDKMRELRPASIDNARIALFGQTADLIIHELKDSSFLEMSIGGPFTIASALRGAETLLRDCRKHRDAIHSLLRAVTDTQKGCIDLAAGHGAGIAMADPVANPALIGPLMYEEFVYPYTMELTEYAEKKARKVSLHMCGNTYPIWKYLRTYPLNELSLDNVIDMDKAAAELGDFIPIAGNVDPVSVIMNGSKSDIFEDVARCMRSGRKAALGFTPATGCDIPEQTDPVKISWFMEAVSLYDIAGKFVTDGCANRIVPVGNGHINDSYLVETDRMRYVLQRINDNVFKDPEMLMHNISLVTDHLRKKIILNGGDPLRETLNFIPAGDGRLFVCDNGQYWRMSYYVEDTYVVEEQSSPENMYEAGRAYGRFGSLLADFPAEQLHETIRNFHDTRSRFNAFMKAYREDALGRAGSAPSEIQFVLDHEKYVDILNDELRAGRIPLRVTHNDTKLNNVLFDKKTGKAICVIDLDTVMPGLAGNDFGDAIRSGIATAAEDEPDTAKVGIDLELFRSFARGYLEESGDRLTDHEKDLLPVHALIMTLENGIRFLTDYLEGDVYFKTDHETHNLERCRTQFRIVSLLEQLTAGTVLAVQLFD